MGRPRTTLALVLVAAVVLSSCAREDAASGLPIARATYSYIDYEPSVQSMAAMADLVAVGTLTELRNVVWTYVDEEDPFAEEEVYDGAVFVIDRIAKGRPAVGDEVVVRYQVLLRDPETKSATAKVITDAWRFSSEDLGSRFALFLVEDQRAGLYYFVDQRFAIARILDTGEVSSHFEAGPLNPWFVEASAGGFQERTWDDLLPEFASVARENGQLDRGWRP